MKLVIAGGLITRFIALISNLKHVSQDIMFRFSSDGLYIQEFDTSRICIVVANLNKDWFNAYVCDEDEDIGINAETLATILTKCFNKDFLRLCFETSDAEKDKLSITMEGNKSNIKRFCLPCMEINSDLFEIPEMDFMVDLKMDIKYIMKILSELSYFDDETRIECDENTLKLISDGDMGKMEIDILNTDASDNIIDFEIEEDSDEKYNMTYSLRFLNLIGCFSKLSKVVNIHLQKAIPIHFVYSMDYKSVVEKNKQITLETHKDTCDIENYVKFYIAPKIDDEYE